MRRLGLDIGSTTLKGVILDENDNILYKKYLRHRSKIPETATLLLNEIKEFFPNESFSVTLSGSAGMGLADAAKLPFVQEVYAEKTACERLCKNTDVVIELGGEDAKILFLSGGFEMRMNGTCAGGTGAFIDQMAALMGVTPDELNFLAANHKNICSIASRCGVFAKSDIQPLLNQGAPREDIAAGIFYAVVAQTVAGLSQGRKIEGNILYLGGPLYFLSELRRSFDDTLNTKGICPENALYFVAIGAAMCSLGKTLSADELLKAFFLPIPAGIPHEKPLFDSKQDYEEFLKRHEEASKGITELKSPGNKMYLGVDAGSTTVKAVLCDEKGDIFRPFYTLSDGDPVKQIKEYLTGIYSDYPDIKIAGAAVTGYGESIIKSAFSFDTGIVETVAHYTAAKKFRPNVDFLLDIGGQDIKCFKIRNGMIDSIYLNEACSSGCGSFLQTFAGALGCSAADFSKLGLFAKEPVSLGSRCTVFMNSSVKQAQKDGADIQSIAAGLCISVVKNALYKVIRCSNADELGQSIVVQGGTFLNDCVLRAFEQITGREVIRPKYAELMGAYGAALFVRDNPPENSSVLRSDELKSFSHDVKTITCSGCTNKCALTVNTFSNGERFIAGNRCSKPLANAHKNAEELDLYSEKQKMLARYMKNEISPGKRTIGLPLVLNFYELLPFWHTFFSSLGFNVLFSPFSDRKMYLKGQHTIPSDTVCYPAKLIHGHIEWLLERKPDAVFYPDMSYNLDERKGADHFNCPVVAYYPQVVKMNIPMPDDIPFICDFLSLAKPAQFEKRIYAVLKKYFPETNKKDIHKATAAAYGEYGRYLANVRKKGREIYDRAKELKIPIVVLAGRPYHVDGEINHGINQLITSLGAAVISEDSICDLVTPFKTDVRNQWTYHARLYFAAKYIADTKDKDLLFIQLVSFGCGVDAITTDEARRILEEAKMPYTQIKIDEISNMGAASLRIRSLLAMR